LIQYRQATTSPDFTAIAICEPNPALQLTAQDYQLMSENRILRLKPVLRLEWQGQHGQNEVISATIAPT
jgi:hypothetical protein